MAMPSLSTSSAPAIHQLRLCAVCLDGTPPGYHFLPKFGDGSHKWLLHIEGGSWCRNFKSCAQRKKTNLGSSDHMDTRVEFVGILSDDESQNPDFYNWNKVKIRYCDGASFSGDVEDEIKDGTGFFFRDRHIWEAVMGELLSKGLFRAKQAFLTGCSAGGLSTYIHCDDFRALLPKTSTVKCLADDGFFLDVEDISGRRYMRGFYNDVARLQNVRKKFPHFNSDMEPGQCFFPREVAKSITTPMFILNPAYDVWQVEHVLSPVRSDPKNLWQNCRLDITKCSSKQLEILQGFRKELLDAISEFKNRRDWGMFIDSCFIHCQSMNALTWHSPSAARINKTVAEAVGDWFFNRREVKEIDCEYPCNPTCYNKVLDEPYKED
uniref:Pectin acetylesterase n=1 Tax=Arundo donax TaxID=35708 RepID=A0A0A8XW89_ARUDO